jgi:hypothetical protein
MSTAGSEARREVIRKKLAQCAGGESDANALAEATVATWSQISARLARLIGARGVDTLLSRTVYLTSVYFPWLAMARDGERGAAPLDGVRERLARQDAPVAAAASCEFLLTFTVLLATLIGDSLTDRLLGPVWASPLPASERESGL